jgi:hypothetical protein
MVTTRKAGAHILAIVTTVWVLALAQCGCVAPVSAQSGVPGMAGNAQASSGAGQASATIAGFAFVGSNVTGQGSMAKLPAGTKIYPPGSKVTGTDGCPTNPYYTDGLPVVIIDYQGRSTAGSVAVTRRPATGGRFDDAPYYLDVNSGRTIQYLGPIFINGSYDVRFTYSYNEGLQKSVSTTLVLARSCGPTR